MLSRYQASTRRGSENEQAVHVETTGALAHMAQSATKLMEKWVNVDDWVDYFRSITHEVSRDEN
jgi:hypothetical protein